MDCIFCKLDRGEIPTTKLYEDDFCFVVADIHPSAPVHLLVIPHTHIASIAHTTEAEHGSLLAHLIEVARRVAVERNLLGYKLLFNVGRAGGQEIFHLHLHLLAE